MRLRWLLLTAALLAATPHSDAYERFVSPDQRFEAYTTPHWSDGTGMVLFLRRFGLSDTGLRLHGNNRWIDAHWSPDSRFLAMIDHPDGHVSDVYVYGISSPGRGKTPIATLLYHSPRPWTYDVKWEVLGWRLSRRSIILKKEMRDQGAGPIQRSTIVGRIGTTALKAPPPHET